MKYLDHNGKRYAYSTVFDKFFEVVSMCEMRKVKNDKELRGLL